MTQLSARLRDTPVFTTNLHKIIMSLVVRGSEEIRRTVRGLDRETDFLFAQRLKTLKNNLTRWSKTEHIRLNDDQ